MRVLHVISSRGVHGGAEQMLAGMIARTRARGWESTVLIPLAAAGSHELAAMLRCEVRLLHADRLVEVPGVLAWMGYQLAGVQPDLIHAHLYHATVLTALMPAGSVPRLATHHHGDKTHVRGQWLRFALEETLLWRYDHVVAVSEAVAEMLRGRRVPPRQVSVIHNGWAGTPPSKTGQASRPTVLCVAALRPEKDHPTLLRALRRLREAIPDVQLWVVGPGRIDRLRQLAQSLGVIDAVSFLGAVDQVWDLHREADVFVLPSRFEPAGIAALEAMASGLPLVVAAAGGLTEIVEDGRTGLVFQPGDHTGLADVLIELLSDKQLRTRLGGAAKRRADDFRIEDMTSHYVDLYMRMSGH